MYIQKVYILIYTYTYVYLIIFTSVCIPNMYSHLAPDKHKFDMSLVIWPCVIQVAESDVFACPVC